MGLAEELGQRDQREMERGRAHDPSLPCRHYVLFLPYHDERPLDENVALDSKTTAHHSHAYSPPILHRALDVPRASPPAHIEVDEAGSEWE